MQFKFQYKRRRGTCEYQDDGTIIAKLTGNRRAGSELQKFFDQGVETVEAFCHPGIPGVKRTYRPISCFEDFVKVMKQLESSYWIYEVTPKEAFVDYKLQTMYHSAWYGEDGFEFARLEDDQGIGFVVIEEIASGLQTFFPFELCFESEKDAYWYEKEVILENFPELQPVEKMRVRCLEEVQDSWRR